MKIKLLKAVNEQGHFYVLLYASAEVSGTVFPMQRPLPGA